MSYYQNAQSSAGAHHHHQQQLQNLDSLHFQGSTPSHIIEGAHLQDHHRTFSSNHQFIASGAQRQPNHFHPLNFSHDRAICCTRHILELCSFFKSQGRNLDSGDLLASFFGERNGMNQILQDDILDYNALKTLFTLCNEHAARYTVQNDLERASILLDGAQNLYKSTQIGGSGDNSQGLLATLYSNISCYYEKLHDDQTAMMYLDMALQMTDPQGAQQFVQEDHNNVSASKKPLDPHQVLASAISYNNLCVLSLKAHSLPDAMKAAKRAVLLMEPLIYQELQTNQPAISLSVQSQSEKSAQFNEKFQVLLIAYYNLGVCQERAGSQSWAQQVYGQGLKMSKRYLGDEHFFTQKFQRKVSSTQIRGAETQKQFYQTVQPLGANNRRLQVQNFNVDSGTNMNQFHSGGGAGMAHPNNHATIYSNQFEGGNDPMHWNPVTGGGPLTHMLSQQDTYNNSHHHQYNLRKHQQQQQDNSNISVVQKGSRRKIITINNNTQKEDGPTTGQAANSCSYGTDHSNSQQNLGIAKVDKKALNLPNTPGGGMGGGNMGGQNSERGAINSNSEHAPSSATGTSASGLKEESPAHASSTPLNQNLQQSHFSAQMIDKKLEDEINARRQELFRQLDDEFKARYESLQRDQENKLQEIMQKMQALQVPASQNQPPQQPPTQPPAPTQPAVSLADQHALQMLKQQEALLKQQQEEAARVQREREQQWAEREAVRVRELEAQKRESDERVKQMQQTMQMALEEMQRQRQQMEELIRGMREKDEEQKKTIEQQRILLEKLSRESQQREEEKQQMMAHHNQPSSSAAQHSTGANVNSIQGNSTINVQPSLNKLGTGKLIKQPSILDKKSLMPQNQLAGTKQNSYNSMSQPQATVAGGAGGPSDAQKSLAQPEQQTIVPNNQNGQQQVPSTSITLSIPQNTNPSEVSPVTQGIKVSTISKQDSIRNKSGPQVNLQRGNTQSAKTMQVPQSKYTSPPPALQQQIQNSTTTIQIPQNPPLLKDTQGSFVSSSLTEESRYKNNGQPKSLIVQPHEEPPNDQQKSNLSKLQQQPNMIKDVRKGESFDITNTAAGINQQQNAPHIPLKSDSQINAPQIKIPTFSAEEQNKQATNLVGVSGSGVDFALNDQFNQIKQETKPLQSIPPRSPPVPLQAFTFEQINQIVEEDSLLYDASILLKDEKIIQQLKPTRTVSQVIYCDGLYYKMYCQGSLLNDAKPMIKIFGICEDPKIVVQEEELSFFEIKSIFKLLIVKDVLPPHIPLRNVRTFQDLCRYFIFPFMNVDGSGSRDDLGGDSSSGHLRNDSSRGQTIGGPIGTSDNSNPRHVELWGRPPGLLSTQAQIMLLKNRCNVSLHHVGERTFRLSLTSLDIDNANSLYLDLIFDETSFEKYFQWIDPEETFKHHQNINLVDHEIKLKSLKIVERDFLYDIDFGMQAFESYLINEFGPNISFSYLFYERTGLIYQLRLNDEGSQQELWCLRDDNKNQCFNVTCRTLYEVRLKKHLQIQVERFHKIDYQQLWIIFGISINSLTATQSAGNSSQPATPKSKKSLQEDFVDRSQLIMLGALLMQTLFLHMPTMELSKGDAEDSDYEEEVLISMRKIECVIHMRKLLDVNGEKIPLTISLLGFNNKQYLGIKVAAYNPSLIKELGFFFSVNQEHWALSDEQKSNIPKKRTMKTEVLHDFYHLPEVLKKQGFSYIVNNLILKKNEKLVRWKGPHGFTAIDVFESYFHRSSML